MPCLLVFTRSEETMKALTDLAANCGWDIRDGGDSSAPKELLRTDNVDAALFDLPDGDDEEEKHLQVLSDNAQFLPLVFLCENGVSLHELGAGLRYYISRDQIPDLEHILISLSLGFPGESFDLPREISANGVPRLLIVDDNLQLASLIGRALRSLERYDVQVVTSGFEALSILPAFRPDVAVVDLVLRDMDGREICSFIRSHEKLQHTKIIGVSGYLSGHRAEDDHVQCDVFIEKPFRMRDIVDQVAAFLQK
jgi:CheY-like chemotaxis protein